MKETDVHLEGLCRVDVCTTSLRWSRLPGVFRVGFVGASSMAVLRQLPVHLALLISQLVVTSATLIAQRLLVAGMDQIVYSFYCAIAALLVLGPFCYFAERDSRLRIYSPDATLTLLVLGLLYFLCQILLTNGIKNTSANFCTAMQPSIPVFGAVFAILMRVEKLNWSRVDGQAKVGGILLCCFGAIVMAVWEGPSLFGGSGRSKNLLGSEFTPSWSLGVICIVLYCIGTSLNGCFIASLLSKYPKAPTTITAYTLVIGAALLGIAGSVHGREAWKVSSIWSLLAAGYNGLAGSAIASVLIAWSIGQVGPILATCYMPVQPVTSLAVSAIFLGASVYLGSVLGAVLVIAGLLLISWSRAESLKNELEQPLL